jgi:hypothetical protein
MEMLAPIWLCLRVALLFAGLLAPGAALLRALRLPRSVGGCFAGSAVVLYGSAFALNALGLRLSLASLAAALTAVTLAALLIARRRGATTPIDAGGEKGFFASFTRLGALTPVMLLFWGVIGFLLWREPLAGPDIQFRWAFLPEQWLRHGNLDFYPPISPADFLSYFWVESIPPGVASLHAWAFACGGGFAPAWTVPVTALQFLALHDLAWRAGAAAGGEGAARPAAVLTAACPLLNWSCRLGQETGLTSLAALGLAVTLLRWRSTSRPAWAAAAGLFAALGAMTREYGLVFPALALAALLAGRASRAAWGAFALAALPLALAWPLRCALRTGNPFYSLDVAGLLPVNAIFVAWVNDHRALFGAALADRAGWLYVLRWLTLGAGPALVGWIALLVAARRRRSATFAAAAVAGFLGLWFLSVPYTVGGLFYSLRVASPALAIGAVAAGVLVAGVPALRIRALLLGALLLATLPYTLLLPENPAHVPRRGWPAPWRPKPPPGLAGGEQVVPVILAAHPSLVLTDSPGFQPLLAPHGVHAIPFWSPQAAWLFDPQVTPADAARRWRESGLHIVVLSKFAPAIAFINRRARWGQPPFRLQLLGETPGFMVLNVEAPSS